MNETKRDLLMLGIEHVNEFCKVNHLIAPKVFSYEKDDWHMLGVTCAYWRNGEVHICPDACAFPSRGGRSWSWPGYVVDRTPFGVMCHELGHHVDYGASSRRGSYYGDYSVGVRKRSGEKPITSYCPNDSEWFAEIFRLFATNPGLLRYVRPVTYSIITERLLPSVTKGWRDVLDGAPPRYFTAALNKGAQS
jgi:hypothetical protein